MFINVLEIFEDNIDKNPERLAFIDYEKSITYRELCLSAKRVASFISEFLGTPPLKEKRPIIVFINRSISSIIAFLGVVYSGNFYVPVDISQPIHRVKTIIDLVEPLMIINTTKKDIEFSKVYEIEELMAAEIRNDLLNLVRKNHIDTDLLYMIFTSGSTGRPKGVAINHRSVIDLVEQFNYTFNFPSYPIFGNQAPFDFDVSVKDIYNAFFQHGTVCIIPKMCFTLPIQLIEFLSRNNVNVLIWAVSALRIVENHDVLSKQIPESLKLIMFSGEVMPIKVLNYWRKYINDAVYVNLYGPTEITCNCSYYIVDKEYDVNEVLPIGTPFRNTDISLLDLETGEVVKESMRKGEICVRGSCLSVGYYRQPEITSMSFIQNPLVDGYSELIYKTGDIGYYSEDGQLMYLSRKDYQVKLMGHRIELGEIENVINSSDLVDVGVCIFNEEKENIALFYQPRKVERIEKNISEKEIILYFSERLPKYMWPTKIVKMNSLPLNKNGKIDRVLLRKLL